MCDWMYVERKANERKGIGKEELNDGGLPKSPLGHCFRPLFPGGLANAVSCVFPFPGPCLPFFMPRLSHERSVAADGRTTEGKGHVNFTEP